MRASSVGLMIILGVAGWLRFQSLGERCLIHDEPFSVRLMEFPISEIIERSADTHSIHPPLYFILLHVWSLVFGQSELALRSLAALAGVLTVGGAFFFLRQLVWLFRPFQPSGVGRMRAEVAALLFALWVAMNPMQIELSRQVRHYSLGTALFLWASWALVCALRFPARAKGYWFSYGLLALALCYTHYLAIFSVAAQGLFLVVYFAGLRKCTSHPLLSADGDRLQASGFRWACFTGVFIVLGYLPWVLNMLGSVEGAHRGPWHSGFHIERIPELTVIAAFSLDDTFDSLDWRLEWGICGAMLLAVIGLALVRRGSGSFLLICLAVPLTSIILYSLVMDMEKYLPRYLFLVQLCWMGAICLLICSAGSIIEGSLLALFLSIWVGYGFIESWRSIGPGSAPGMRAAAEYIVGHKKADDLIVAENPHLLFTSSYYLRGLSSPLLCTRESSRLQLGEAVRLRDDDLVAPAFVFRPGVARIWLLQSNFNLSKENYPLPFPLGWAEVEHKEFLRDRWESPITVSLYIFKP